MAENSQPVNAARDRLNEPLQFKLVNPRPRYSNQTDGPVEYVAVANEACGVIGYIWANDVDNAASWEDRPEADDAIEGAVLWFDLLRYYKTQGLRPSQALARIAEHPGDEVSGRVVAGSRAMATSLADLRRIAGQVEQAPPPPPEH